MDSTWAALRHSSFRRIWLSSAISGICVVAHNNAATCVMNRLTDSPVFISLIGPNLIFAANAGCFLFVTLVLRQLKQPVRTSKILQKPGLSSFSTTQQVTRSRPLQVILARNFEFSLFISAIPSVLPNLGLKVLHFSSSDLGLLLTSMGIGSVIAAIIIQPWVRTHCRDNALMFSNSLVIIVYLTIGFFQQTQPLNLAAALAGAGWTLSASELWARGQAAIPDWARGRMTAAIITISQGATVLGGLTWGSLVAIAGPNQSLLTATILFATTSLLSNLPLGQFRLFLQARFLQTAAAGATPAVP